MSELWWQTGVGTQVVEELMLLPWFRVLLQLNHLLTGRYFIAIGGGDL